MIARRRSVRALNGVRKMHASVDNGRLLKKPLCAQESSFTTAAGLTQCLNPATVRWPVVPIAKLVVLHTCHHPTSIRCLRIYFYPHGFDGTQNPMLNCIDCVPLSFTSQSSAGTRRYVDGSRQRNRCRLSCYSSPPAG